MTKQIYQLTPHQAFTPRDISGVSVRWTYLRDGRIMLRYRIDGGGGLELPDIRSRGRGDALWENTCCELFLYDGDGRYREYNFAPSGQWAVYSFSGYRQKRMDCEPVVYPEILPEQGHSIFMMTVFLSQQELAGAQQVALSAVVMEEGRRPSYWALSHHKLEPDFHDPACFNLRVPTALAA